VLEFGLQLIRPSYSREPLFAGSEMSDRFYSWKCVGCRATVLTPLDAVLREAWSWKSTLGEPLASAASSHFELNAVGKSHDGGIPSILLVSCSSCNSQYLLYAGVSETSNSVYQVIV
jgi:hypothetical protein